MSKAENSLNFYLYLLHLIEAPAISALSSFCTQNQQKYAMPMETRKPSNKKKSNNSRVKKTNILNS